MHNIRLLNFGKLLKLSEENNMDIKSYKVFNPKALMKFNLSERLHEALDTTNAILRYVDALNPLIFDRYVETVQGRFS